MRDLKTGIHEPTVIIPWWMDCRDSGQINPITAAKMRKQQRDYERKMADLFGVSNYGELLRNKAASYNRERINEILGG